MDGDDNNDDDEGPLSKVNGDGNGEREVCMYSGMSREVFVVEHVIIIDNVPMRNTTKPLQNVASNVHIYSLRPIYIRIPFNFSNVYFLCLSLEHLRQCYLISINEIALNSAVIILLFQRA